MELAIAILIIAILITVSLSFFRGFYVFAKGGNGTRQLAAALHLARNIAIKSNEVVYFTIDLDKESYHAYRLDRSGEQAKAQAVVKKNNLPSHLSLVRITSAAGGSLEKGKVVLHLLPSGVGEDMAIYLGDNSEEIEATVVFNRYTGKATIHEGEMLHNLESPQWEEPEE